MAGTTRKEIDSPGDALGMDAVQLSTGLDVFENFVMFNLMPVYE
jgi:hypothetical protein